MIIYIISSPQKGDSPGNVPCIHELNCILLSSPQAETKKQSKFVFLIRLYGEKLPRTGRRLTHLTKLPWASQV